METKKSMIEGMKDRDRLLVGFASIEYPVYMLHLNLKKPNDDSMYFMDWAIIHFIKAQPNVSSNALAWALGMEISMVNYRIKHLQEEGFIKIYQNFEVLPKATDYFFSDTDKVPIVNDSKDLLVDGISLQLMDPVFYEDYPFVQYNHNSVITRTIIENNDSFEVRKVLEKIENMTDTNKQKYGLPKGSSEFESIDVPGEGVIKLQVTFSIDNKGKVHKEIMYGTHQVKIPALNSKDGNKFLDKCCFYHYKGKLRFNEGFNNKETDESAKQIMNFYKDNISEIAEELFGWSNLDSERDYTYNYSETDQMVRPLTFNVSYETFSRCSNRMSLINALNQGYVQYPRNEKRFGIYISLVTEDDSIIKLIEFNAKVDKYKKENDKKELANFMERNDYVQCRKDLILLQRFDVLENIDNERFIQKIEINE